MTKYVNKRTGAVIETDCELLGEWVPDGTLPVLKVTELSKEAAEEFIKDVETVKEVLQAVEEPERVIEETVEDVDGIDGVTVKQIKQELDAFGIAYDPRAKKKELYDLMMQGK